MSGVPGYSIPELITTAVALYRVYENFTHEYRNAPRQISAFRDELGRVDEALKAQDQIRVWTGKHYLGTEAFKDAIAECGDYLRTHKRLLDRHEGKQSFLGVVQTVAAAFDKDLPRLQQKLAHNRIELTSFNVTLILQRLFSGTGQAISATEDSSARPLQPGLPPDKASMVESVLKELFSIGNVYKRLNNGVLQVPDPGLVRPEDLDVRFQNCIASLCTLVDLPTHRLAQLPLDDVSGQIFKHSWQAVIESSSNIIRYTNDSSFERSVSRTCRVRIVLAGDNLTASSYIIFKRCCYWRDEHHQTILEHQLPQTARRCFPYTSGMLSSKPFIVGFLDDQDIIIRGLPDKHVKLKPQYHFTDDSEYIQFQSDLRAKDLEQEADIISIASKTSGGRAVAHNERVKIWTYASGEPQATISFPARLQSRTRDFELRLRWFGVPEIQGRSTVRLTLLQETSADNAHSAASSRDPASDTSSFLSRLSVRRRSSTSTGQLGSSAASISSVSTSAAQSQFAPKEWVDLIGYLDLKFAGATETLEFLQVWEQALSRPSPAPTARTNTTASTAPPSIFSNSPSSMYSIPGRSIRERSSTAGTSPVSPTAMSNPQSVIKVGISPGKQADDLQLPGSAQDEAAGPEEEASGRRKTVDRGTDPPFSTPPQPAQAQTPSSFLHDRTDDSG